jgi:hypothetical protein
MRWHWSLSFSVPVLDATSLSTGQFTRAVLHLSLLLLAETFAGRFCSRSVTWFISDIDLGHLK